MNNFEEKNRTITAIKQILCPPSTQNIDSLTNSAHYWFILSISLAIPLGAVFHHALFYRPTCMLNPFGEAYYISSVLLAWLSTDPSLPWAIVLSTFIYNTGKRYPGLKIYVAPVFIAFLPLSIWIWDIPFTGRFICDHFHDAKLTIFGKYVFQTRYLYAFGLIVYLLLLVSLLLKKYRKNEADHGSKKGQFI